MPVLKIIRSYLRAVGWIGIDVWIIMGGVAAAADQGVPTREDLLHWVETTQEVQPAFSPGETLIQTDLDKLRPFLPPRYLKEFDFAEVEFPINSSGDYPPHSAYFEATEQYTGQTRLAEDGTLEDYVAGSPFAHALLHPEDPQAGLKAAWNFNYRWQNYGMQVSRYLGALMAKGGKASRLSGYPPDLIEGGGRAVRHLVALYQRVYHSHLAQLPTDNYTLPLPAAGEIEYKDYLEFLEPYDVRGHRFLVYRYADPRRKDNAWSYLTNLRKVRRLSLEQRDDSVGGTEMTLDDFTGFSGRVLDHSWKFLGWKDLLHVMNSQHPYARFYGPNGWLPHDRWELRRCAVVEQVPKHGRRNYSSKIYFWDAQTNETAMALVFDREGKLWKIIDLLHGWSEDPSQPEEDRGKHVPRNIGFTIIDVQKEQATIFSAYQMAYPDAEVSKVEETFNLNRLNEGRR